VRRFAKQLVRGFVQRFAKQSVHFDRGIKPAKVEEKT
jgi:hypothetical protein